MKHRWDKFKRLTRHIARTIQRESTHWPKGYRLHLRVMDKAQSRNEGFALYENRTLKINRRVLYLPPRDWILLAIHEIGGHHLQHILHHHHHRKECDGDKCQASEEYCAMSCERRWVRRFGIQRTTKEWIRYRRARVALDHAVQRGIVTTESDARRLFARHRVPARLTRVRVELLRVRERPGEVRGYIHGRLGDSPDCPCRRRL